MAPTEMLARQHSPPSRRSRPRSASGLRSSPAASAAASAARFSSALAAGDIDLIVGTHALFQDEVAFHDLALAIVDEQHRFGVHQRLALTRKGEAVDLLVLTATPIPRTLVLTYFGDMDISECAKNPPAGRRSTPARCRSSGCRK